MLEISRQGVLVVSQDDSGLSLVLKDLPAHRNGSLRIEVHSIEKNEGEVRQVKSPYWNKFRTNEDIVDFYKDMFDAFDFLKPGHLVPVDPSRVHASGDSLPPDEVWHGYFINLLAPPEGGYMPSVSISFLQRHRPSEPQFTAEQMVTIMKQLVESSVYRRQKRDEARRN